MSQFPGPAFELEEQPTRVKGCPLTWAGIAAVAILGLAAAIAIGWVVYRAVIG